MARTWVRRAGQLTGHGDDLFFLELPETFGLLRGDPAPLAKVPARRATYETYRALPPYPALIRGRFDPIRWAADPNRRSDYYDERAQTAKPDDTITGFPGAAGVVARDSCTSQEHQLPLSTCHVPSGPWTTWSVTGPDRTVAPRPWRPATRQPRAGTPATPPCRANQAAAAIGAGWPPRSDTRDNANADPLGQADLAGSRSPGPLRTERCLIRTPARR